MTEYIEQECALCGGYRPFTDLDREELLAMLNDMFQSINRLVSLLPQGRLGDQLWVVARGLRRDMLAFRERLVLDGQLCFDTDEAVPF
jgi:hypothetical protein